MSQDNADTHTHIYMFFSLNCFFKKHKFAKKKNNHPALKRKQPYDEVHF